MIILQVAFVLLSQLTEVFVRACDQIGLGSFISKAPAEAVDAEQHGQLNAGQ